MSASAGAVRLLVRGDASRAPAVEGPDPSAVSVAVAAYDSPPELLAGALEGVSGLFMVSGAESADRRAQHLAFVTAAARAGVGHIVYTSFFGASADATFTLARDHWVTEEAIRSSGMAWTFLRDNLYLDVLPWFAGADGAVRGPAGDGRVAAVAIDDVADAAAAVLASPAPHAGRTYDLTGPEALTLAEAAARITAAGSHGEVRFVDETVEEAYTSRASYGAPDWQVEAWVTTYLAIARGELARVSDDVRTLTGHPSRTLESVLAAGDHGGGPV